MTSMTVTLYLGGKPTLDDFASAFLGLKNLLRAIQRELDISTAVTWKVDDLQPGSARGTFLGDAPDVSQVHRIADRYLEVGFALRDAAKIENRATQAASKSIVSVLNQHVTTVQFETADDEVEITSTPQETVAQATPDPPVTYGGVVGRIQTLSNRGSLRFTLYDLQYDRAVSCYLREGDEDIMRNAWDKVALVKGWIRRDPVTSRPKTIRGVDSIEPRDVGVRGEWREAIGALDAYGPHEAAYVTIRRVRDAG